MKKKLVVCGDSWFSSDTRYPGLSFPELLANKKNWELISLARGGCSNFAIVLQIKKAIELKADIIIIGATSPDRIEIPIRQEKNKSVWEKIKSNWSFDNWVFCQPNVYKSRRGLSNILYHRPVDLSNQHKFLKNPTIISESINNILFTKKHNKLDDEQIKCLKLYVLNLYDSEIKKQYDSWIISNACREIFDKKIPFLLSVAQLLPSDSFFWLSEDYNLDTNNRSFVIHSHDPSTDHIFHYNVEHGKKIMKYIEEKITKLKIN